jgi:regulation of enolase protein 1 (concanavalin A-like superfamily)
MGKRLVFLLFLGLGAAAFVAAPAFAAPVDIRISGAGDDFEESVTNGGAMDSGSSDLEIPYENAGTPTGNNEQVVGLRFTPVPLSKDAQVTKAYIELEMDETKGNTQVVNVIIEGQLIDNAPAFSTASKDISNRTPTKAQVKWTIPTGLANDTKFQSPDISAIINEIMSQAGWASGNAIVIMIRDDKSNPSAGVRCVEAVEGEPTAAPLLHIEVFDPTASAPDPADGAVGVSMPLFGWTKGDGAVLHNIYFGTTPDLTEANLVAQNQPFAMYYHVAGLKPGTKYYWRVDEMDATGKVTTGPVWSFSSPSFEAFGPSPRNAARSAPTNVKLTWTPGYGAQSHFVYFGTSFDEVDNASGGTPQVATTYTPTGPLTDNVRYFWRVDESDGTNTYKGPVWSFTTGTLIGWWTFDEGTGTIVHDYSGNGNDGSFGPEGTPQWVAGKFGGAIQLDGSDDYVEINAIANDMPTDNNFTISAWIKQTTADEGNVIGANDSGGGHDFIFGTSSSGQLLIEADTVNNYGSGLNNGQWRMITYVRNGATATLYIDGVQVGTETPSGNPAGQTLWSIGQEWDPPSPSDEFLGAVDEVRFYRKALTADEVKALLRGDPTMAGQPSPSNGSTVDVIRAEQGLTWSASENAKEHDVYLGLDKAAVEAATTGDKTGIYRGRQAAASYTPPEELAWGTGPYYWRIDEVQADGAVNTGLVWSFTVADFLIVDDMESYTDDEGSRIYETWIDGWTNNTGAVVGNLTAPFAETTIVHSGSQAMPIDFNNAKTPFYSEAEQTFSPLQDWTTNDVTTLTVWVRGNPVRFVDKGNGAFTVGASGHDIWDNADDFRFVYKRLNGDGSIQVKVDSLVNTNAWAKAGVMIRDSLDAGSQMAYMIESFSSGVSFGWRQNMGLACGSATQAGVVAPQWVKLTRKGNAFTAQYSADGKTWTDIKDATTGQVVSTTIGIGANCYIGLCVTSHNTAATTTAEFSGAATTGGVTGAWQQAWIGDDPDRTNGADKLYVAVEDSAGKVAVASDPTLVNAGAWTEWQIPLSSLTGVNLAKVKKLYIGVGDRKNPSAGGAGRLYIDDIRLTKP